jgi:hypothetical protein
LEKALEVLEEPSMVKEVLAGNQGSLVLGMAPQAR